MFGEVLVFQVNKYPQILHNFCRIKRRGRVMAMAPSLMPIDKVDEIPKIIRNPALCDNGTRIRKNLIIFINSIK